MERSSSFATATKEKIWTTRDTVLCLGWVLVLDTSLETILSNTTSSPSLLLLCLVHIWLRLLSHSLAYAYVRLHT